MRELLADASIFPHAAVFAAAWASFGSLGASRPSTRVLPARDRFTQVHLPRGYRMGLDARVPICVRKLGAFVIARIRAAVAIALIGGMLSSL